MSSELKLHKKINYAYYQKIVKIVVSYNYPTSVSFIKLSNRIELFFSESECSKVDSLSCNESSTLRILLEYSKISESCTILRNFG